MFNPDAPSPKFAPATVAFSDFWFTAYRGLTIWEGKMHLEIDETTGEWYLAGLEISDDENFHVIEKGTWLFQAFDFELRQKENVDLADRISEACLEAAQEGI